MTNENTPVPAEPVGQDEPGYPAPVELPVKVGQQAAESEDAQDRREDAVRRVKNDPRV